MKRKNTGMPRPVVSILPCNDTLTDMTKGGDEEETSVKYAPVNIKQGQGKDETGAHYPLPY